MKTAVAVFVPATAVFQKTATQIVTFAGVLLINTKLQLQFPQKLQLQEQKLQLQFFIAEPHVAACRHIVGCHLSLARTV